MIVAIVAAVSLSGWWQSVEGLVGWYSDCPVSWPSGAWPDWSLDANGISGQLIPPTIVTPSPYTMVQSSVYVRMANDQYIDLTNPGDASAVPDTWGAQPGIYAWTIGMWLLFNRFDTTSTSSVVFQRVKLPSSTLTAVSIIPVGAGYRLQVTGQDWILPMGTSELQTSVWYFVGINWNVGGTGFLLVNNKVVASTTCSDLGTAGSFADQAIVNNIGSLLDFNLARFDFWDRQVSQLEFGEFYLKQVPDGVDISTFWKNGTASVRPRIYLPFGQHIQGAITVQSGGGYAVELAHWENQVVLTSSADTLNQQLSDINDPPLSVAAWINLRSLHIGARLLAFEHVIGNGTVYPDDFLDAIQFYLNGDGSLAASFVFGANFSQTCFMGDGTGFLQLHQWQHVAWTLSGFTQSDTITFYGNGQILGTPQPLCSQYGTFLARYGVPRETIHDHRIWCTHSDDPVVYNRCCSRFWQYNRRVDVLHPSVGFDRGASLGTRDANSSQPDRAPS